MTIEILKNGRWHPLKSANETPDFPCRFNGVEGLFASAWLSLHRDDDAYEEHNRVQKITPYYFEGDPVLIVTINGKLVDQPIKVGVSITIDLLAPHALLPRAMADVVLRDGNDESPEFQNWWNQVYKNNDVPPILVWSSSDSI